jgi:hypothetical protein
MLVPFHRWGSEVRGSSVQVPSHCESGFASPFRQQVTSQGIGGGEDRGVLDASSHGVQEGFWEGVRLKKLLI